MNYLGCCEVLTELASLNVAEVSNASYKTNIGMQKYWLPNNKTSLPTELFFLVEKQGRRARCIKFSSQG